MSDRHTREYDSFDLDVIVDDEGNVEAVFRRHGATALRMDFDTLRDVVDFTGIHGMGMTDTMLVPSAEVVS